VSESGPSERRPVGAERVLAVLVALAEHPGGVTLDELAQTLDATKPTVHRALGTLRKAGLAHQTARGRYELGDEFLRLAFRYQAARPENSRVEPVLHALANTFGETAHFAVLDGMDVVYRAKVDPPSGAIRLTSTIGGRNPAWCTAVGKLLLGFEINTRSELDDWLGNTVLGARTPQSIITADALYDEIRASAHRGYGVDNQENELGVNCVAVPVSLEPGGAITGAVSVSALAYRRDLPALLADLDELRAIVDRYLGPESTLTIP
jgi:IclR family transcriptional regulator, acetate operon repressor